MDIAGAFAAGDQGKRASALFFLCGEHGVISLTRINSSRWRLAAMRSRRMNVIDSEVHKVTWAQVGRVTEPGRYLFTFGWLTITAEDLAVWQQHPNAAFTLVIRSPTDAVEEYRLGAFELRGE